MHWLLLYLEAFVIFRISASTSAGNVDSLYTQNGELENRLAFVPVETTGEIQQQDSLQFPSHQQESRFILQSSASRGGNWDTADLYRHHDDGSDMKLSSLVEEEEDMTDSPSIHDDDDNIPNTLNPSPSEDEESDSASVENEGLDDGQKHSLEDLANYMKEIDEDYKEDMESLAGEVSSDPRSGVGSADNDSPHDGVTNLANSPEGWENRKVRSCRLSDSLKGRIINKWVDVLLKFGRSYLRARRMDPLSLPEYRRKRLKLYRGEARGLSNIHRVGDAKVIISQKTAGIDVTLAVTNVRVNYKWRFKLLFLRKRGRISVSLKSITVRIHLKVDLTRRLRPQLVVFQVGQPKGLRVKLRGLGIFNRLVSRYLQKKVRKILQQKLQKYGASAITKALAKYKFPQIKL